MLIVANPGDKRTHAITQAYANVCQQPARLVSWFDVLRDPACLNTLGNKGGYLRIESSGSDAKLWSALAARGGLRGVDPIEHEWQPGRVWFSGLASVLQSLQSACTQYRLTHDVDDILMMTDKVLCDAKLRAAGVPVPRRLPDANTAEELREVMTKMCVSAVYVKPRWGSSGAGVLAYRNNGRDEQLTSTAKIEGERVFNHKSLTRYRGHTQVDRLLNMVLADGALVQQWLPKAGIAVGPFDMRVLVIHGKIAQRTARIGKGTITNLHLKSARMPIPDALNAFPAKTEDAVYKVCLRAAACFAKSHMVAVDVMLDVRGKPWVLECNAWGDYLPGLTDGGFDSYETQMRALCADQLTPTGAS